MKTIKLQCDKREKSKKSQLNIMRSNHKCPAVLYSKDQNTLLTIDSKELGKIIKHHNIGNTILQLSIDNKEVNAIIKDIQYDPVTWEILHIDLYLKDMNKELDTSIPIKLIGNPIGVREGGILETMLREVHIRCTPQNFPEFLECDISELKLHRSAHVSDIKPIEGVKITSDPSLVIAMVGDAGSAAAETEETEETETEAVEEKTEAPAEKK